MTDLKLGLQKFQKSELGRRSVNSRKVNDADRKNRTFCYMLLKTLRMRTVSTLRTCVYVSVGKRPLVKYSVCIRKLGNVLKDTCTCTLHA